MTSSEAEHSLSLLRATLDSTADGILVVDHGGKVSTFNKRFAELWRLPDHLLAAGDDDRLLAYVVDQLAEPAAFIAKVRELYAAPTAASFDEIPLRDGRVFERYSNAQELRGAPIGRVWSFRDVTAQRAATAARQEVEARLRAVFEHPGVGMAEVAPDGRFLTVNATLGQMLGYSADELCAKRFADITHPDDLAASLARLGDMRANRSQAGYGTEKRYLRRDGSTIWCQLTVAVIRDAAGAVVRFNSVIADITDRRRAEAALALSERRLAEAQRIASIGSWRVDLATWAIESSDQHLAIYGLGEADPPPRAATRFADACHPDDRERAGAQLRAAIATGEPSDVTYRIVRADGAVRVVEVRVNFVRDGDRLVTMIGTTQDITERQHLQDQLVVADRMASIGALAAGVGHEINNPLAALTGNLDLLIEDLQPGQPCPARVIELLADIRDAADRIRNITRDLRIFSRAEEDTVGPIDLERVLDSCLRMAANQIRHRAQVVRRFVAVPPVHGNESRLGQVFLNLIMNAAQAVEEGHVDRNQITITTGVDERRRVVVEVADTGIGISPAHLPHLFQPFHTTKPAGQGPGLGLTICHRIVTQLGGEITVDSLPDRGTVFRVCLPAAIEPPPPIVPAQVASPTAVRRGRVLVVDDERSVGEMVRRALMTTNEVTVLTRATEALALIRAGERYDVILSDVMMPFVTGMEFYRALVELAPDQAARVVFMTGGAFTAAAQEFLDQVAVPLLHKPLDLRQLRSIVNRPA